MSRQLLKNFLSSWIGYLARIIITFIFIPIIAGYFGDARYGVWVIIFQAVAYFSLVDFGLTSAITRFVSKNLSLNQPEKINRYLNSANAIYLIIGTAAFFLIYLFADYLFPLFKIEDAAYLAEGQAALKILGLFMATHFYLMSFGNSLAAFQRHDLNRYVSLVEEIIRILIMIFLIKSGYGLVALATTMLTTSILKDITGVIILKRIFSPLRFSFKDIDQETVRELFGYSKIAFGITAGWLIIFNTDSVILGLLISSTAAGVFTPAARLMLYLRNIINTLSVPLIPAISHLEAKNDYDKIRTVYLKGLKYTSYFSFYLCCGVILYADSFTMLWLPPEFIRAGEVMIILAIGTAFFLPQIIGNSILFGIEKHKYLFYIVMIESFMKILLAVFLTPLMGIIGMALSNTIPQVLLYSLIFPLMLSKIIKLKFSEVFLKIYKFALLGLLITYPAGMLIKQLLPPDSWMMLSANIIVVTIIFSIPAYFIIEPDDRQKIKSFLSRS